MNAKFETENRGHTDTLVRNVWLGCFAFIAAFAAAIYLTMQFAGDAANDISVTREQQLVAFDAQRVAANSVAAQQRLVKTNNLFVETLKPLDQGRNFDRLISNKLTREAFTLFGILDDTGNLVYSATQFGTNAQDETQELISSSLDLVHNIYVQFDRMKEPAQNGYVVPSHYLFDDSAMTAFGFRYLGKKLHLIVVQAVLPTASNMRIETERPFVSVATVPIPNLYFSKTAAKIGMMNLFPARVEEQPDGKTFAFLPNGELPSVALLAWDATMPKTEILQNASPYLALLALVVLTSTTLVGLKFASVLKAFGLVNRKNRFMARHCGLTKLANRSKFDDLLETAIRACHEQPVTLFTIDLDKFKPLNDTYGHDAGDLILINLARRFEETVGEFGTVARLGGDEFVILLHKNFGREMTQQLATELIDLAAWPIQTPYGDLTVGCSIGVANAPKDGRTASDVMRRADEAMYHSKRLGGSRVTFAEDRIKPMGAAADFQTNVG
ncbi:diguanylate cyclase domain-containing protein [Maritalea sp.]|jgi:diguanylate cyclase (GGDEF)-like protein|uniref:diguanylate cyclase domain-containing protein n=1 Tax=Maritalea sp. TaxID=2003361 RepID=UPI0039E40F73